MNKYIRFYITTAVLSLGALSLQAQQVSVKGTVTDASTNKPLRGVNVSTAKTAAITDENGRYSIAVTSLSDNISFDFEGYLNATVALRGDSLHNVKLFSTDFRPALSSETFAVAATDLAVDELLSAYEGSALRGVSRGGSAAAGANMYIRGYNSLNASAQPLVVVDGVIWEEQAYVNPVFSGTSYNLLADIDVNDIEDVKVLRDATSIYGAKGANGAIIITTKTSHSRVTRIDFDASWGFQSRPKTYKMLGAEDFRKYVSEIYKDSGNGSAATSFQGIFGTDKNAADYPTYHNDNNWYDDVYRTGNTGRVGISIDGSDDVAKYAIMFNYTSSDGVVKSTDYSRIGTRVNAQVDLTKSVSIQTNLFFSTTNRSLQDDGIVGTSPTYLAGAKAPFMVPYTYTDDGSQLTNTLCGVDALGMSNPVALVKNAKNSSKHYRFGLQIAPKWQINRDFSVDGRFSYMFASTKEHYFSPMEGMVAEIVDGDRWENTVKDMSMSQQDMYADINARYGHLFNGVHRIDAAVGWRMMTTTLKNSYADGHNTGNDKVITLNNTLNHRSVYGVNTDWNSMVFSAQANYSYDNRYYLWAIVSEDGSSRFGRHAKGGVRMLNGTWGFFPSVGARWNISGESFMRNADWISEASVFGSYGITGNDGIDGMNRYAYLSGSRFISNSTGLRISSLANENLKWESVTKWNVGAHLAFLNNRLAFDFAWYVHKTKDMITYKTAPINSGKELYLCNGGSMQNKGFEMNVSAKALSLGKFSWLSSIGLSSYKNKITALPDGDYSTDILGGRVITSVGNPLALFYGYKTDGVFSTAKEAAEAGLKKLNDDASYSSFAAGDVHFIDVDKNGIIDEKDRQVIGDPNPDFTGNFFNRFSYGNVSLEVLCTYSVGGDIYNYARQSFEQMTDFSNQTQAVNRRWKTSGQVTDVPRAVYGDPMQNSRFSDRWIEDGSYFKVKSVKVAYTLPIRSTYIHGLTIWASANDLLTLTKYLGSDPEVSMNSSPLYQGIDCGLQARGRSYYMGVRINL